MSVERSIRASRNPAYALPPSHFYKAYWGTATLATLWMASVMEHRRKERERMKRENEQRRMEEERRGQRNLWPSFLERESKRYSSVDQRFPRDSLGLKEDHDAYFPGKQREDGSWDYDWGWSREGINRLYPQ